MVPENFIEAGLHSIFTAQRIHHFIQFVLLLFHPAFIFFPSGVGNVNFL